MKNFIVRTHSPSKALLLIIVLSFFAQDLICGVTDKKFNQINLIIGNKANSVERKIANLLSERILEKSDVQISISSDGKKNTEDTGSLNILLGLSKGHKEIEDNFMKLKIPELTQLAPGPEGFLLQWTKPGELMLAGIDNRACLYAVGELLRQMQFESNAVVIPANLHVRTAPAFEIRGTQFGQSHVALRKSGVRKWTEEETQRVILNYALAGANTFSCSSGEDFDFIKSFDLMTQGGFGANTASEVTRPEWAASESIGRLGYVCLSVPAAREYMLQKCDEKFKDSPTFDFVKFHGGDGGGCECDLCKPYGLTFISLVEEMAAIIHKYHPETKIYFTNQKFNNEDDQAIFSYLQEKPRNWLWAWGYGPGSDAASWQPGHRQNHRMDLFRYPGYGPYGLYPREILHQLPPQQKIIYYNEITHWKYAQHAYIQMYPRPDKNGDHPPHWSHDIYERQPDQYLTMVYDRLTFYAWPRNYFRVFHDLMPYGIGDITHSSGHHDHFNQWMWQRLLWAPRTPLPEVVKEYCQTWFGREAAPAMAEAIFQLEENLEEIPGKPLPEKEGILRYYQLVKEAGQKMPVHLMKDNWLWRMYMQKAALDRYVQLAVSAQLKIQHDIEDRVEKMLSGNISNQQIQSLLQVLDDIYAEDAAMQSLREEAQILADESNRIFGVKNDGLASLLHDFIGLGWMKRQLERAIKAKGSTKTELLKMITDYEYAGEGGFYDNFGTANPCPNAVFGYPYDHGQPYVAEMLSNANRHSQKTMHYTQDEAQGVTLMYDNLDPEGIYKIRFTLVRPWFQERYATRMNQKSQSIYANGISLAEDLEIPMQMSDFFTFDIPRKIIKDGTLKIEFKKAKDVATGDRVAIEQWRNSGGWGTIVSEAWLIRVK
ncbi:MAG: hypothetical protein JJU28_20490 [Cyclobacteriaceae bacterium]|nr:hypothetical protein [Cyclobacteriaceae bacterium]